MRELLTTQVLLLDSRAINILLKLNAFIGEKMETGLARLWEFDSLEGKEEVYLIIVAEEYNKPEGDWARRLEKKMMMSLS